MASAFMSGRFCWGCTNPQRSISGQLVDGVPGGDAQVVGGEMEGVGLLAASTDGDPVWCVVKGISDFADKNWDETIAANIPTACRNAAAFVLSALVNDAKG